MGVCARVDASPCHSFFITVRAGRLVAQGEMSILNIIPGVSND